MSDHPKRRASDNRVRKARKRPARPAEMPAESRSMPVPVSVQASMLNFIAGAVTNKDVTVDKVEALLRMQKEYLADEAKAIAVAAFAAMQVDMPRIKKNGVLEYPVDRNNPRGPKYTVTHYAKWEDIDEGVRPIYGKHGFGLTFRIEPRVGDGGGLLVTAILLHAKGYQMEATIPVPLDTSGGKNNVQGYGSALSYGKRYAATAVLNIVTEGEDDDAVKAGETFISEAEVAELHALCQETGRREVDILRRMFGDTVLSFNEVPPGTSFIAVKNTLLGIRQLQQERRQQGGAE